MKVIRRIGRGYYDWRSRTVPERVWSKTGIGVIVAVHNRSGRRVENFFRTLRGQTVTPDLVDLTLVDYGSTAEHQADLRDRCWDWRARYVYLPVESMERRRSHALNCGLRQVPEWCRFVMATDIDMIFAPDLLEWVIRTQLAYPPCLTLCQFIDLPEDAITDETDPVSEFDRIRAAGKPYDTSATGPCLGAPRRYFHDIGGWDERLYGEDHDDYDMQLRARMAGRVEVWIDDRTSICHQWHWRRFEEPRTPEEIAEHERYKRHWESNKQIVQDADSPVRNVDTNWGELPPGSEVIEPPERRR